MNIEQMRQCAPRATALMKIMANENRLFILCNLLEGELCVNSLTQRVGLSQSAMSQHLAKLRKEGFVKTRKESQTVYYSLSGEEITAVLTVLRELFSK